MSEVEDLNYRHLYRSIVYRLGKDEGFSQDQVLQLRQACAHPQLVAHSEDYYGSERISMEEIFFKLVDKTKKDYESAIRDLVVIYNKFASLYAFPGFLNRKNNIIFYY